MEFDTDKIDDAVLGLLWLTLHDGRRAWKGFVWTPPAGQVRSAVNVTPNRCGFVSGLFARPQPLALMDCPPSGDSHFDFALNAQPLSAGTSPAVGPTGGPSTSFALPYRR